jgi:hypothetical protein
MPQPQRCLANWPTASHKVSWKCRLPESSPSTTCGKRTDSLNCATPAASWCCDREWRRHYEALNCWISSAQNVAKFRTTLRGFMPLKYAMPNVIALSLSRRRLITNGFDDQTLKFIVLQDPAVDFMLYPFGGSQTVPSTLLRQYDDAVREGDARDPRKLLPFLKKDGKLIMFHGYADTSISPFGSIAFFRDLLAAAKRSSLPVQDKANVQRSRTSEPFSPTSSSRSFVSVFVCFSEFSVIFIDRYAISVIEKPTRVRTRG